MSEQILTFVGLGEKCKGKNSNLNVLQFPDKTKVHVFGRSPVVSVPVCDLSVSRKHLSLAWDADQTCWTLIHHKSVNRGLLNSKPLDLETPIPLKSHDHVSLGPTNDYLWLVTFKEATGPTDAKCDGEPSAKRIKVSDSVPAPETLPPKEETRIEAVGAASNLQCIQEGPSVTPKSATVLSDPPSRSSSVDGLNPNPSIILSPHVLVIDSTEVPQDRDVNSTSSVINTVSTCSRKGTSEANQEHLNSLEGDTGKEDKCSAQQTDGNDAVVTENDDSKKTRNSDEKEQKEEESGGVVSRIREKIQEELSCAICNEVFISPQLLPCQHVFCSFCLLQWKKKCSSGRYDCPNCRQKIGKEKVHPNRYLENLISSWMGELGPEHLKQRENAIQERKDQEAAFQAEEAAKKLQSKKKRGKSRRGGGQGRQGQATPSRNVMENFVRRIPRPQQSAVLSTASSSTSSTSPARSTRASAISIASPESSGTRYNLRSPVASSRPSVMPSVTSPAPPRPSSWSTSSRAGGRAGDPIEISSDEDEPGPENDHNSGDDTSDTSIEQDLEEDGSDSDESVEGLEDAYYGGYGNCFSCGRRGHWAPGCPF